MTLTLRAYQTEAVERAIQSNQYIAFDCGMGKTVTAIEIFKRLCAMSRDALQMMDFVLPWALVVVSPKVTLTQWESVIQSQHPEAQVILGTDLEKMSTVVVQHPTYVVVYYQQLKYVVPMFKKQMILAVIADEAHNLNNRNTTYAIDIKKLRTLRKIAMSATPIQDTVADMWSVLNWLYPDEYTSYWKFADKYTIYNVYNGAKMPKYTRKSTMSELSDRIRPTVLRKLKSDPDVAPDMPPMTHVEIPVDMNESQSQLYRKVRDADDLIIDLRKILKAEDFGLEDWSDVDLGKVLLDFSFPIGSDGKIIVANVLARMLRLQQIAAMPSVIGAKGIDSPKLEWVLGFLANNQSEHVAIFSRFRTVALEIHRAVKRAGFDDAGLIVGGRAAHNVDEFRRKQTRVLVGTIGAMGTALDLPMATSAIFFDREWSSIKMYQATQRIDRLVENPLPKTSYYLDAKGTVDYDVRAGLNRKLTTIEIVNRYMQNPDFDINDYVQTAKSKPKTRS